MKQLVWNIYWDTSNIYIPYKKITSKYKKQIKLSIKATVDAYFILIGLFPCWERPIQSWKKKFTK